MRKKCKIHMLPTDKDAAFFTNKKHPELFQIGDNTVDNPKWQGQHLYFTSNEEIKDHEPSINIEHNTLIIRTERGYGRLNLRKIVATTNPDLWYNNKRTARGEFENLSKEEGIHKANFKPTSIGKIGLDFVKRYVKEQGNIKEVELEIEECKHCIQGIYHEGGDTMPIACPYCNPNGQPNGVYGPISKPPVKLKLLSDGTVIIHNIEEKMYTREEFKKAIRDVKWGCLGITPMGQDDYDNFDKWFDKNYPK